MKLKARCHIKCICMGVKAVPEYGVAKLKHMNPKLM
jgi:hypothetical protein